jgi:thiol:disulfide interchange protein
MSDRRSCRSGGIARFAVWTWLATALAAAGFGPAPGAAQQLDFGSFGTLGGRGGAPQEVELSAEFTPATADRPAVVFVTAQVAEGYHIYALDQGQLADGSGPQATTITLDDSAGIKLLAPFRAATPPHVRLDEEVWEGLELREHDGEVVWFAPVELPEGVDADSLEITGALSGQACNPDMCVPLDLSFAAYRGEGASLPSDAFPAANALAATGGPADSVQRRGAATPPSASESPLSNTNARGSLANAATVAVPAGSLAQYVLYGVLGGLILNLMPCVLPVIGLKLLSFAKQGGQSRGHILGLNLAYSAGLMTVFMVLATLAALVQLGLSSESYGWGELYTLTWFKVAMTALVFAMALAFLGVWEIPIPGFASSGKATEMASQEGPAGAFVMGMVTTLLSVPCSGPFLGPVFGYTISQPPSATYLIFASVGVGMALPYLLIGAFPALVSWLPKPGAWMDTLKSLLGFGLLATVVYLFSTLRQDYYLPTLALMFAMWFGLWIVGRTPLWAEVGDRIRAWGWGTLATAVLGGGAFALLSPSSDKVSLAWEPYSPAALAEARASGKTVLVDFTANWCPTCKLNSKIALNRPAVKKLVEENGVVALLADWTDKNATIKQAIAELNSRSIPLMAIYPAEPGRDVIVVPDLLTQGKVIEALKAAGPSLDAAGQSAEPAPVATGPNTPEFGARKTATLRQ